MKRKLLRLASLMLVFSGLLGILQTQPASAWENSRDPKITVCHANSYSPRPYDKESAAVSSVNNISGHQYHNGDIIPIFWFKNSNGDKLLSLEQPFQHWKWDKYNGKNWDNYGKSVWNNNCNVPVNPSAPYFTNPTCQVDKGSYVIPYKQGVYYKVNGSPKNSGPHNVSQGSSVIVTAHAYPGYTLFGTTSWSHTFEVQESCIEEVTPAEVTFVDPTCEVAGSYTIPEQTGVAYQVDGATVPAGTYSAEAGESVTVTAVALEGFSLIGTTGWSHPFVIEGECEEDQAIINYDVVCGRDGATVTFTNTGNVSGEVTLNGEVITVEAGATVERLVETGKDGQRITIVVGDETVYDELVDCDKGEVLGGSTVRPTALPNTSGDLGMAIIALLTLAGAALSGLSFAARKLAVRAI